MSAARSAAQTWTVAPARCVRGAVRLPGDKSISHRALILSALSPGDQQITGLSTGLDVAATARILVQLGVRVELEGTQASVGPLPPGGLQEPGDVLDCGNSGTSMRLLAGLLAGQPFLSVLTGDASLRGRPMRRVVEPLRRMGARVDGRADGDRAPLVIRGGGLVGIEHASPVASAQVKSCLMLAGLFARGQLRLTEPAPSRDHSERMLAAAGVALVSTPTEVTMACGQGVAMPLEPVSVPADVSGAAFFIAAASMLPGSSLRLPGVGCNPTRTGFGDFLGLSGSLSPTSELGELRSDLLIEGAGARGEEGGDQMLSGPLIPRLIDEIPVLGVLAARRSGVTRIREAADLRAKETDRIETTAAMLRVLGVRVDTQPDGMDIHGLAGRPFSGGGTVEASGDHRIAMAAAVGALAADGPVTVRGVDAVDTSFPGFLSTLESVVER